MMQDIVRICTEPTAEDRDWFPDIAGTMDWRKTLRDIWANYRDESFIRQYLSPRLMREFKLFVLADKAEDTKYRVNAIHDEEGYQKIRAALASSYDLTLLEPDIQVADVDLRGNRELVLRHNVRDGIVLAEKDRVQVLEHIRRLWGYRVRLEGLDQATGTEIYVTAADAMVA
jgi:stage V sporulation protein R